MISADIYIGDEVYFASTPSQYNHDLYWIVRGKKEDLIQLELNLGHDKLYHTVNAKDIQYLLPFSKNRQANNTTT